MFIYETAKFAPVWTTTLKIRASFVHQTSAEHALYAKHDGYQNFRFSAKAVIFKKLMLPGDPNLFQAWWLYFFDEKIFRLCHVLQG